MQYLHTNLGIRFGGDRVAVELNGSAANVRLLDEDNYLMFLLGGPFFSAGQLQVRTRDVHEIPYDDQWHLLIDLAGLVGSVSAKVAVG
jgi:hypothetical protein